MIWATVYAQILGCRDGERVGASEREVAIGQAFYREIWPESGRMEGVVLL